MKLSRYSPPYRGRPRPNCQTDRLSFRHWLTFSGFTAKTKYLKFSLCNLCNLRFIQNLLEHWRQINNVIAIYMYIGTANYIRLGNMCAWFQDSCNTLAAWRLLRVHGYTVSGWASGYVAQNPIIITVMRQQGEKFDVSSQIKWLTEKFNQTQIYERGITRLMAGDHCRCNCVSKKPQFHYQRMMKLWLWLLLSTVSPDTLQLLCNVTGLIVVKFKLDSLIY